LVEYFELKVTDDQIGDFLKPMTDGRFYRFYQTTFLVNMADSSDKDAAAAVFVMLHTSRKHKKRKIWVRPWIMQRYICFSLHSGIILLTSTNTNF